MEGTWYGPSLRAPLKAIVVSQARFFRDWLADLLSRDPGIRVDEGCATLAHTLAWADTVRPDMVFLDAAFPNGLVLAARLRVGHPSAQIVALPLAESDETVQMWAEAGITGYVPSTTSLSDLSALLSHISWGEPFRSSRIAGALHRRIGGARTLGAREQAALTGRERDILRLVGLGLTNKEIARNLDIGIGTAKSHVHSILGKLQLQRRSQVAAQINRIEPKDPVWRLPL